VNRIASTASGLPLQLCRTDKWLSHAWVRLLSAFCPSQPNSDFRLHFCWMETDGMCRHPILLSEHDIYFQPRDTEGNTRTLLPNASNVSSTEKLVPSCNDPGLIPEGVQFECRSLCRMCRPCVYCLQSSSKNAHIVPGIWLQKCNSPSTGECSVVLPLVWVFAHR